MAIVTPTSPTGPATPAPAELAPTTPPPAAPEEKPEDAEAKQRFSQMARREKMIRAKAREIQAREEALKSREAQFNTPPAPDTSWKDKFREDPISMMSEAGMSYDDLLAHMANSNPQDQTVKQLQLKLKNIEENIQQRDKQAYDGALNQIKVDVTRLVQANPDEYEAIHHAGPTAHAAVVALIERTYKEDGYVMDIDAAARDVEEYLTDQAVAYAKLKKVQQKLTPTQAAAQAEVAAPQTKAGSTTLSHSMTGQSKPLTPKERRERAILAFQGKLST